MKYTMLKKLKKLLAIAFACTSAFGFAGCADLLNSIASAVTDAIENQVFEDGTVDENYVYTRTEGGGSYYYERLTPEQQKFYIKVRIDMDKFFAGERELKKYTYEKEEYRVLGHYRYATFDLTKDAALQAFDAFYQDCPQYYAYDGSYMLYGEESLSPVIAAEYDTKAERDAADVRIAIMVDKVRDAISDEWGDFEVFNEIRELILEETEYEYDTQGNPSMRAHAGNIVGVLDGDGSTNSVCVGYTFTATYLSNVFGVECISVGNDALNHAWNMVKLDGVWYHNDITNDDGNKNQMLFLCGEDVFWKYFDYSAPAYDSGAANSMGRVGILPTVSQDLYYSRFIYRTYTSSGEPYLSVDDYVVNQYRIRIPSTYLGLPVTKIEFGFSFGEPKMQEIILPVSMQEIETYAFKYCPLEKIYYEGTAAEYAKINIGPQGGTFSTATVYYFSETEPTEQPERYWHYNQLGEPIAWSVQP